MKTKIKTEIKTLIKNIFFQVRSGVEKIGMKVIIKQNRKRNSNMSQKRQADSVPEENKTKMSRVTNSVSRMSDVMFKLFRFQDGSEYQYSITPNTLYTHFNITVYLFFYRRGRKHTSAVCTVATATATTVCHRTGKRGGGRRVPRQ